MAACARLVLLLLLSAAAAQSYSVLTHEAIVDSLWETSIRKMLAKRFPAATPEDLDHAHAFAYGGCIVQDMGYYPFSSHFFSDLAHYVRSGDFVAALIRDAQDVDEYSFALGALAHYAADNSGHRIATNLAVPILYPELRAKFGPTVTYWDSPISHLRTEFGFDVLQVALGRYAPDGYRAFIGFEVSKPLLERAFHDTYGLNMNDLFASEDLAFGTFRYSVSSIIPEMTRVAWGMKKETLIREIPGITRKKFLYTLSRASYRKQWGTRFQRPGFGTRFLSFLLRLVPKFGPFRSLAFRPPTPEVERLFMASFNATVTSYRALLAEVDAGDLKLLNDNLDLGAPSRAGQYTGTDLAYDKLLDEWAKRQFKDMPPELRSDILAYYGSREPAGQAPTRAAKATAEKVDENLARLKLVSN